MQEGRPLAFEIKQFKGNDMVKSTYEKEMATILNTIKNGDNISLGDTLKSSQIMMT